MKRPLIFITVYFILGILIGQINNISIIFSIFTFLIFLSYLFSKIYKIKVLNLLTFVTVFSLVLTIFNAQPRSKELEKIYSNNEFVKITGNITRVDATNELTKKIVVRTNTFETDDEIIKKSVNLLVYIYEPTSFYLGEEVFITGYLAKASVPKNPTDYNEKRAFQIQNIEYKIYPSYYEVTAINNKFTYALSKVKENLSNLYYKILPESEASILNGIILGNKSYIDQETLSVYKNAGIYHILAISGLHITILAGFLCKIFDLVNKKYSKIIVILILVLYCIFTGASISTIRATIMATITLLGGLIYKRYDLISSTCMSALILLTYEPMYIFDIGFLYSFSSVLSIAFLGLKVTERENIPIYIKPFIISFFVGLTIKPITMYNFYTLNFIDIFLNVLVLPFMSIVVGIGFLAIIIASINFNLATFVVGFIYYILRFFTYICTIIDRMEFSNIIVGKPSNIMLIAYYLMILFIAFCFYDKHLIRKRIKFIKIGILIFFTTFTFSKFVPKHLEITMLSTSKGEVFVGEYNNFTFLIDGGNKSSRSTYSVSGSTIIPYLNSKGISKIDAIFVTNSSDDYITGAIEVLDLIEVGKIFVPSVDFRNSNYVTLFEKAYDKNIQVFKLRAGDKIFINDMINFECLYPTEEIDFYTEDNLVFKINFEQKSILFTNFIDENLENIKTQADILKVSTNEILTNTEFLKYVNPSIIISRLDLEEIDLTYNKALQVFSTSSNGAINMKIYKNGKILTKTYK